MMIWFYQRQLHTLLTMHAPTQLIYYHASSRSHFFLNHPSLKSLLHRQWLTSTRPKVFLFFCSMEFFFHGENATCLSYLHGRTMELREQILSLVQKTCVICRLLFPCVNLSGSQAGQGERKYFGGFCQNLWPPFSFICSLILQHISSLPPNYLITSFGVINHKYFYWWANL